jgi:chaperonin GroES
MKKRGTNVAKAKVKAKSKAKLKAKLKAKTKTAVKASAKTKSAKKEVTAKFMTPLEDRLLISLSAREKKTPGGLYIPDTVSDVSGNFIGHVVATGLGKKNKKGILRPLDVKIGDEVVFSQYSGDKVNFMNNDYMLVRESEILGVRS